MKSLIGWTKKLMYRSWTGSHYSRLTAISSVFVQKYNKTTISTSNQRVDKLVVNKNMTLRYCHPKAVSAPEERSEDKANRPLAVLVAWMLAKDSHIEKYRNLYFKRGFDVLTVKTSPFELLLPQSGSQRIARNLLHFMNDKIKEYPQIVVHSFSVGGYQFGEVLVEMEKKENQKILKNMVKAIKGLICDSGADMEAIPSGLSRAVIKNPVLRSMFKHYISTHMKVFHSIATKHYIASSKAFKNNIIRCPGLLLVSHDDVVGNPEANRRVMECWQQNGIDVYWKCFDSSSHVGHLMKYPEEYEREVNSFLNKIM